ncbi:MAG: DUF3597 domain-containing protein [Chloroflexota bacterium]
MGLFSKILDKLGLGKKDKPAEAPAPAAKVTAKPTAAKPATASTARQAVPGKAVKPTISRPAVPVTAAPTAAMPVAAAPVAISEVDVVKKLEQMAEGSGLDWKVSIVDLLKVLGIDSSREARNELATELGCPPELMKDSAKMNVWLHKAVLKKIAENGGNIPASLLD